jgi:hypothetical protein
MQQSKFSYPYDYGNKLTSEMAESKVVGVYLPIRY